MSPHRPVLYSFRRCPYAIRARIAVARAGVACELREVLLGDKPAEMLELSPKGTVPVLALPDGMVIDESRDIMVWALTQSDPDGWLGTGLEAAPELIRRNDEDFKPMLDRYKYFERYPEHPQAHYRDEAGAFLTDLDQRLATHDGGGLTGRRTGFADVAIFPFVRQFAGVDRDWFDGTPWPNLASWLKAWEANPLFLDVMKKYPVWQPRTEGEPFP